ncbi:MAG: amidohydrolase family protein [Saprospiraceae bacterium]
MKKSILFLFLVLSVKVNAQQTFPKNGPADIREGKFAFINATLYKSWNEKLENASLIISKGKIEAAGLGLSIPPDAVLIDLKGKFIYPAFIDLFNDYGMPDTKAEGKAPEQRPQMLSNKKGAFSWNEALKTEFKAEENFQHQSEKAKILRSVGFGTVLTHRFDGISRGSGALVSLADLREHELLLKPNVAHFLSFSKGTSTQDYPSSLMGCIALLRQTYFDAQWYQSQKEEINQSLETWNSYRNIPQIFAVGSVLEALRANKIAKEFGAKYIIKGVGDEYKRLKEIKETGADLILSLKYPDAFDVEDPYDALQVDLSDLKHWEMAPSNASRVAKAGISFAFTSSGLKNTSDFLPALRKTVENGLPEEIALKALTMGPADMIKASNLIGSLEKGKVASFFICSGNIFSKESKIYENWVSGRPYVVNDMNIPLLNGEYELGISDLKYKLIVTGSPDKYDMQIVANDTVKIKCDYQLGIGSIALTFSADGKEKEFYRLSGNISEKKWSGRAQISNGDWVNWSAALVLDGTSEIKKAEVVRADSTIGDVIFPALAFGNSTLPKPITCLFKNTTVWTNEKEGILKNTDVLVANGKIIKVGKSLTENGAVEIDGTGKHLTAGIIDEHSHIAISRGVNEGTQESSAEVRIADVVNSDDINIYRNLAGGVTAVHLLHGSANPIGGQTQLIKLKWGYSPEEMKFPNWDGFIKFALGENPKHSNGGDHARIRYPQSRMGVEQVYEDYFTRAEEYSKIKSSGKLFRKDLDLETILEILEKKRFITCHSYVQSEINMLMKVAEKHNFKVNTFTHILEGYKVADKMAKHGAGGSSFSDWWDYKMEVYNAIPHNAAIMHEQGVVVAINSDDAEMSRRLNQEAAKSIKYGGVSEEDAWKFITLNPAKLLHIDDRTGSIKVGKDADLVLWSENPLSVYAKAEMTFVDGIRFFDIAEDKIKRSALQKEKSRIIQKMIVAKKNGDATTTVPKANKKLYHCDDDEDEMRD